MTNSCVSDREIPDQKMADEYEPEMLQTFLRSYYKRLFPYSLMYKWLSYGEVNKTYFSCRELSFTLKGDVYLRYQSFSNLEDFQKEIQAKCPEKIDIGAVFNAPPKDHKKVHDFQPQEKELVFDIDMTDYDDVRQCCSEANICLKCWPLMKIAVRILDAALRDDFGYDHILWVYSGRRGIHCWVCDEGARKLTFGQRASIADYLTVVIGGQRQVKKVQLRDVPHPSVKRSIEIIRKYFVDFQVVGQDFLGNEEQWKKVLQLVTDSKLRCDLENKFPQWTNSLERWENMEIMVNGINRKIIQRNRELRIIEEIMLQYCYPRLDINVSKGLNHLLKSPFCVHPKTGRVCVPFDPNNVDVFDPFKVPTISQLVDEINEYDTKTKQTEETETQSKKVQDYKKTSMCDAIRIFQNFVKGLETEWHDKRIETNDQKMEF